MTTQPAAPTLASMYASPTVEPLVERWQALHQAWLGAPHAEAAALLDAATEADDAVWAEMARLGLRG